VDINIRVATASDAPMLAKARFALRSSTGPAIEDETEFVRRCTIWMEERLREGSSWRCWIAEKGQSPVGNVWVQLIEKIPNPAPKSEYYAYLSNFYVNGDVRGAGIGSLLLSVALNWCRDQSVHAVILWPTERSRSLYLRHDFAVRDDVLELLLEK
jgi:GNAT superfamily N-acetyltransferase